MLDGHHLSRAPLECLLPFGVDAHLFRCACMHGAYTKSKSCCSVHHIRFGLNVNLTQQCRRAGIHPYATSALFGV